MPIIQILLLLFALFALSRVVARFREGKLRIGWFVFWLAVWFGIGIVVFRPEVASLAAAALGVTRGADLAIYLALVALFYLVFRILLKIEQIEQDITKLTREMALRERGGDSDTKP